MQGLYGVDPQQHEWMQAWLSRLSEESASLHLMGTASWDDLGQTLARIANEDPTRFQALQSEWLPIFLDAFCQPNRADEEWLVLIDRLVNAIPELSTIDRSRLVWMIRQLQDADRLITKTRVALKSETVNLEQGLKLWREDLLAGAVLPDTLRPDQYRLGDTLAVTPGDVVFENQLFQLIQYRPVTDAVHAHPVLLVPAFVNRYYILDLSPELSMVRWLVSKGHTVCLISWVNPSESLANYDATHYVLDGVLAALDQMDRMLGGQPTQLVGYCAGGVLAAIAAAWLKARGEPRVQSLTLLTTLLDYTDPGPLGQFVSQERVDAMAEPLLEKGYLPAEMMLRTFASLKPADLLFSRWMHAYVLGERQKPLPLLHWLGDGTRTPAALVLWVLRTLYLENRLIDPVPLTVAGQSIDLSCLELPVFLFACERDDISPWRSTLETGRHLSGPVTYVLGQGGHNSGVICPPERARYDHFVMSPTEPLDMTQATSVSGSWWETWARYLEQHGGEKAPPPEPGGGLRPVLEPAPGRYVKQR